MGSPTCVELEIRYSAAIFPAVLNSQAFFSEPPWYVFPLRTRKHGWQHESQTWSFWSIADIWVHWWFDRFTSNLPGPDLFRSILEAWNQPKKKVPSLLFEVSKTTSGVFFLKNKLALHVATSTTSLALHGGLHDSCQWCERVAADKDGSSGKLQQPKGVERTSRSVGTCEEGMLGIQRGLYKHIETGGIFWVVGGWERETRKKRDRQMMQRIQSTKEDAVMRFLDDHTSQKRRIGWVGEMDMF